VIIPQANVRHLMLRPDVIDAMLADQFHIYPITHIDQGLELLFGVPAGDTETPDTVHYRVNAQLKRLARELIAFDGGEHGHNGVQSVVSTEDR
jgi:predicted ATP-dependent protease